jgi:hypothetical protein
VKKARLKIELPALNPWDTWKARREIRQALSLASAKDGLGHLEMVVADWFFEADRPYAVSFRTDVPEIRCTLVLNGRSKEYFGAWPSEGRFQRLIWLMEAYFSSLEARDEHAAGGVRASSTTTSPSPEVVVNSIARSCRGTYVNDKRIDGLLRNQLRAADGRPLSLAVIHESTELVANIERDLNSLPALVQKETTALENRMSDLMTSWQKCAGSFARVVGGLAAFTAAFDDTSDWHWRFGKIHDTEAFRDYIAEDWALIHADWRTTLTKDHASARSSLPEVIGALKSVLARLGIHFLDAPRGTSLVEFRPAASS